MPARLAISDADRFGVWKAWSGRCFWCKEPVLFKNCHVDHTLPLAAAASPGELEQLRKLYNLPEDYRLDSFANWVPACASCNQTKSNTLIDHSPAFSLSLTLVRSRARLAIAIADSIKKDRRKAPLLAKLASALEEGDISKEEIEDLLLGIPALVQKSFESPQETLLIAPGWQVLERLDGRSLVVVRTPSGATGVTSSAKNPHSSWYCPTCGNLGPWDGIICRSCGMRNAPD